MKGPHDFCATSRVLHRRHRRARQAARDPSRGDRRERSRHALRGAPSPAPCVTRFPAYASTREDAEIDGSASALCALEKAWVSKGNSKWERCCNAAQPLGAPNDETLIVLQVGLDSSCSAYASNLFSPHSSIYF